MDTQPSKYTFEDSPDGRAFTIHCDDKPSAKISLQHNTLHISKESQLGWRVGLYEYRLMMERITDVLYAGWERPKDKVREKQGWKCKHAIRSWARTQTAKALSKRVHEKWLRLLDLVPTVQREVQKAYFAATTKFDTSLIRPELFQCEYLVKDIIKYRAAAIAAPYIMFSCDKFLGWLDDAANTYVDHWMKLYSHSQELSGSLRKTLTYLPGGLPSSALLDRMRYIPLQRPVRKRLELATLLSSVLHNNQHIHTKLLMHTTEKQIKKAADLVGQHLHQEYNLRKFREIAGVIGFICDYPQEHRGNLVGLAEKSIKWHRSLFEQQMNSHRKEFTDITPTAKPPVPLPTCSNITFLDTVKSICEEGVKMGHCISGYVGGAVNGSYYLFHIEYKGDIASAEVSSEGRLVQARGPRNCKNKATMYAERVLSQWGNNLVNTTGNEGNISF